MTVYTSVASLKRARPVRAATAWVNAPFAVRRHRPRHRQPRIRPFPSTRWTSYACGLGATIACTAVSFPIGTHVDLINIVMVYMLGSALAGLWLGRGASALTAVLNVVAFDFFFVPPRFSLAVYDVSYLITFSAMLLVSLIITRLVIAVREQIDAAQARERHTAALLAIARELSVTRDGRSMSEIAVRQIAEELRCGALILLCDEDGRVGSALIAASGGGALPIVDMDAARSVAVGARQGGTERTLYLALSNSHGIAGVLVVGIPPRPQSAAGAAPTARWLCGAACLGVGASSTGGGGRRGPCRGGEERDAQYVARLDFT